MRRYLLGLGLAVALAACSTPGLGAPITINTLATAELAGTLATRGVDGYVTTAKPDVTTLKQIQTLNNGLHTAIGDLEKAQAAGQSLSFAAAQAAEDAFVSYAISKGIPIPTS